MRTDPKAPNPHPRAGPALVSDPRPTDSTDQGMLPFLSLRAYGIAPEKVLRVLLGEPTAVPPPPPDPAGHPSGR